VGDRRRAARVVTAGPDQQPDGDGEDEDDRAGDGEVAQPQVRAR
jgi:hypothetical protein